MVLSGGKKGNSVLLRPVIASLLLLTVFAQSVGFCYQAPAPIQKLNIEIVEGEGAVNNIRQRMAREPMVQVTDEKRKPVAGAAVVFLLQNQGAGASFANGAKSLTTLTDANGRAVAAAPATGVNAQIIGIAEVSGVSGDIGKVFIAPGAVQG